MKLSLGARNDKLDAIRALAVILVLGSHFGERLSSKVFEFENSVWNVGVTGVFIFFCVSGYVIPMTMSYLDIHLGRTASLRTFWIKRTFRLLPLYIVLMVPAWAIFGSIYPDWIIKLQEVISTKPTLFFASTLTFTAYFFDLPMAFGGLEWTLAYEFIFYIFCSLYILVGMPRKQLLLWACLILVGFMVLGPERFEGSRKFFLMMSFFLFGLTTYLWNSGSLGTLHFTAASSLI